MLLDYYPGWVGGLTLTIKLISAQLNYAAAGAGLSLAIYDAVHGMGQPTYIIDKYYLTRISGP